VITVNIATSARAKAAIWTGIALAFGGYAANAVVIQHLEPSTLRLGESAQLTIASDNTAAISPPMVAGLEFVAAGQSQRIESINGVTHVSTSVTYQVIPQQVGVFTIPSATSGAEPVILTVNRGGAVGGAARGAASAAAGSTGMAGEAARAGADGSAFVRLRIPTHDLYVGETIPVDIQVATRDGAVASLNGPPVLNGDAFTLNKLSAKPQRTQELVDGRPFTVFTWHSTLAAVKPGILSLTMETPLSVRIPIAARHDDGFFGGAGLDELFNDTNLQDILGGASTEKQITVTSRPASFTVKALPVNDRPADFSGAVGHFTVTSDLSEDQAPAGDPLTLSLHVTGTGNFDRVNTRMLHDVAHFKTYAPTAAFQPVDELGYRGEKTFSQPVIAMQPGVQALPALSFSWFDPATGHYAEAHNAPLHLAVIPNATTNSSVAANIAAVGTASSLTAGGGARLASQLRDNTGLRPDQPQSVRGASSLMPNYYRPAYLVAPSALVFAWLAAGLWMRRRDVLTARSSANEEQARSLSTAPLVTQMDEAAAARNAALFFAAARLALARALALQWHVAPDDVTTVEVDARLGEKSPAAQLFKLADEACYSTVTLTAIDFRHWKQIVLSHIGIEAAA
jgi:hypothetical protein